MKTRFSLLTLSLLFSAVSLPAFAHDPKLHKQVESKAPDCARMKDMDMSKMDMSDPVMMAMHEKCKSAMQHDDGKAPAKHQHDQKEMKNMPGMDMPAGKNSK